MAQSKSKRKKCDLMPAVNTRLLRQVLDPLTLRSVSTTTHPVQLRLKLTGCQWLPHGVAVVADHLGASRQIADNDIIESVFFVFLFQISVHTG